MELKMDENVRYKKIKKALNDWEVNIAFNFYDNFLFFLQRDYCKDLLKKAKSDDERLMVYLELLAIYVSISLAKIRRMIEEIVIDYDHGLFENLILPLISRNKKDEPSKKTPESYEF